MDPLALHPELCRVGLDIDVWAAFERAAGEDGVLGRVVSVHYGGLFVRTETALLLTTPSARIRRTRRSEADQKPAVGDWVVVRPARDAGAALLKEILPRRSQLVRRAAGGLDMPQIVAANVDVAMVCMAVGADYNVRRLERYLALAEQGGVPVCVVLTKIDVCEDVSMFVEILEQVAPEADVFAISAVHGKGLEQLDAVLGKGTTAVLLGSSGVGKSTLLNALAGETHMAARAVREKDDKGRHTTTHRELFVLPSGALLIDTPGLREVGLVGELDEGRPKRRGHSQRKR